MPLFFIISGIFHPKNSTYTDIKKRIKGIILPYFLWSSILFCFWLILGRNYGESSKLSLSIINNLIGVFYAQGDRLYMDWGIPMWFLPTIFLCYLFFHFIQKINNKILLASVISLVSIIGFTYPMLEKMKLPWSIDVACVAILFYSFGFFFRNELTKKDNRHSWVILLILGFLHLYLFKHNIKVDMYRSIYGNELLFLANAITGSLFYLLLFKKVINISFLSILGKLTIPILAMQLRAVTFIKLILLLVFGITVFNFNETQKIVITIFQIGLIVPVSLIINKYLPILNGGHKKI